MRKKKSRDFWSILPLNPSDLVNIIHICDKGLVEFGLGLLQRYSSFSFCWQFISLSSISMDWNLKLGVCMVKQGGEFCFIVSLSCLCSTKRGCHRVSLSHVLSLWCGKFNKVRWVPAIADCQIIITWYLLLKKQKRFCSWYKDLKYILYILRKIKF